MELKPAIKAYSYLRFSTPEQAQGDSFRRQALLAETYALQHDLVLDRDLTFHDAGVSAYRGRNAGSEGQLGLFLEAIRNGIVPVGSYLLVESLDRISRQTARRALRLLEEVVEAGAIVVTLIDGRKYDQESLDNDPVSLLISILTFMRAHEESAVKASRLKATWSEKRNQAVKNKKPMTSICPAWLELDHVSGLYSLIPERVNLVKRIFSMTLEGMGQWAIAQTFNQENIPPFGRGVYWHRTYIAKILSNHAVLGVFIPHVQEHSNEKRIRRSLDPIENYFPPIIDRDTFDQLQSMRAGAVEPRRGRHAAKPLNNIFGGLGRCATCGSTMTMTNKGDGNKYLICTRAKAGAGCKYKALQYQLIEDSFIIAWSKLLDTVPDMVSEVERIRNNLQTLQEHMHWLDETIGNIMQTIEGSYPIPTTLIERLGQLENERSNTIQLKQESLQRQLALESNTLSFRVENLRKHLLDDQFDKVKVNAVLRQLFHAIHIAPETKTLEFEWHHSELRTPIYISEAGEVRVQKPSVPAQMPPPLPEVPKISRLLMR